MTSTNIYPQIFPSAYVYKITDKTTGEFYIGSRTAKDVRTKYTPEQDLLIRYFTSGKLKEKIESNRDNFKYEIIFRSNEDFTNSRGNIESVAYCYEQLAIMIESCNLTNPKCLNKHYNNPNNDQFTTTYKPRSQESIEKSKDGYSKYLANRSEEHMKIRSAKISAGNKAYRERQSIEEKLSQIRKQKETLANKSDEEKLKTNSKISQKQLLISKQGNHIFQTDRMRKYKSTQNKHLWDIGKHPLQDEEIKQHVSAKISNAQSKLIKDGTHIFKSTEFKQKQSIRLTTRNSINVNRESVKILQELAKIQNISLGKGWKLKSDEWINLKLKELSG